MMKKRTVEAPPVGFTTGINKRACKHDYMFLRSEYQRVEGPFNYKYLQLDVFYCRHCLEYKRVVARDEDASRQPVWFRE